jgi:hypothetical protein
MMKGMCRVALMMGMVAFSAASAEAVQVKGSWDDAGHEVRVVNNYPSPVRVYVQDANGRMHLLGRVARGKFKVLKVSAEIAQKGDVRLKVYPNEPVWSLVGNTNGIKTKELSLQPGDAVTMWLETDLTQSMIEVQKG